MVSKCKLCLGLSDLLRRQIGCSCLVPGGNDGPSGVLVCSENYITYKNLGDQPDIRVPIPRRRNDLDDPERGLLIVCSATHKTRSMFFFLVQTEQVCLADFHRYCDVIYVVRVSGYFADY